MDITARFQTVLTNGFSRQNGDNPAASGGVTFLQLKKAKDGKFYQRAVDSNGRHQSVGRAEEISEKQALEIIKRAADRDANDAKNGR